VNERLISAYHRLPGGARSMAATLWGLYLRSWRYGADTDRLAAESIDRERWDAERWTRFTEERMAAVLHAAATEVPYYREQWNARKRRGDRASWEHLENWPILEKQHVRANPRAFVRDGCRVDRMFHDHTSGTSGTALTVYESGETVRAWYALAEARWRRAYGVTRRDRWAILGGQLVRPASERRPPFWVWNAAFRQLYMSSYHLAPDLITHYLDALLAHRITYVLGYSSSLYALAAGALREGRRDVHLRVAITNAEPLFDYQRRTIEEAFGCPVRETYGMAELVAAAGECEHGALHLWPEAGHLEVFDRDVRVPTGATGDLVATGLLNVDMPLVRYRIGDRGSLAAPSAAPCACGRTLPVLAAVEGRTDDVLYARDGRPTGRLDPVFKTELPILEAQIVQERIDRIRIRYVPAPGFSDASAASLVKRVCDRLGQVDVVLEAVTEVPRTRQGKFRAVLCEIPEGDRPGQRQPETVAT
jgi:phenylacetate-CoA ligase